MNTDDPTATMIQQAIDALRTHNWTLLFAFLLMLGIWALRWGGKKIPGRIGAFIASNRGAALLNVAVSFVATIITSLIAHRPLTDGGMWTAAITASVAAAGGWAQLKAIFFPPDAEPLHKAVAKAMRRRPSDNALLIMMALSALCMLGGCGPRGAAFGNTLGACELGKLPTTLETVIADVTSILFAGGESWQTDLEGLGYKLAPGQVDCVVQAVGASVKSKMRKGQAAEPYVDAARRADVWLARGKAGAAP